MCALLLTAGCWDARGLDQRGFVVMVGIDKTPEGRFRASVQMLLPQETAMEKEAKAAGIKILVAEGDTVRQAVERTRASTDRELDVTFLDVLVISPAVAANLEDVDWFVRSLRVPVSAYVTVSRGEAEAVVRARAPGFSVPAEYARASFNGNWTQDPGVVPGVVWRMFNRNRFTPLEDPYAPVLDIADGALRVEGLAVFRGQRLVGRLNMGEAALFNLVTASRAKRSFTAPVEGMEGATATVALQKARVRRTVTWEQGRPVLHISVTAFGDLQELVGASLLDGRVETTVEASIAQEMANAIRRVLKRLQEVDSDAVGFGELARQAAPYRQEVQSGDAWHRVYRQAQVDVKAQVTVVAPGYIR